MKQERITTATIKQKKTAGTPITMLTAYDFPMAKIVDEAGIDMILVGDSLGNVMLGYDSTIPVTMDEMVHHVKAVGRAVRRAMVIADMPFLSYQISVEAAMENAGRFLKEAGAQAIKLEGGAEVVNVVSRMAAAGIPVVGHLGLTPQSLYQFGGFKVQGKDVTAAKKIIADAKALEEAGAFAIVLECVPAPLAKMVTDAVNLATIGIGAGPHCDGQVLVIHDILGLYAGFTPKFVKRFADLHEQVAGAVKQYKEEVEKRVFPATEHCFAMSDELLEKLY